MPAFSLFRSEPAANVNGAELKPRCAPANTRVYYALVSPLGAICLATLLQTAFVTIVLFAAAGGNAGKLRETLGTPFAMFWLIIAAQLGTGLWPLLASLGSRESLRERLAIHKASISRWTWPAIMLATVAVAVASSGAVALGIELHWLPAIKGSHRELAAILATASPPWKLGFVLSGSLLPGVCEELLFRGYMQSRLLKRWSPPVAIGVTSIMFAAMHIDPTYMVFVLPSGVWLGYLAWRTGSILPGIACHAFVNFVFQGAHALGLASQSDVEHVTWPVAISIAVSLLVILGVVRLVERQSRRTLAGPTPLA